MIISDSWRMELHEKKVYLGNVLGIKVLKNLNVNIFKLRIFKHLKI